MEQSKFYQIKNVTECEYTLVGCDGSVITRPIQEVDKIASAFTVQDAKDGDVLAAEPIEGYCSPFVAIYKKQDEEDFDSYCCIGFDGGFYKGENGHSTDNIHPATKEQREQLEKAITDAGYTFDFDKKELKEIEQKPTFDVEIPFGRDSELIEESMTIPDGCYAVIEGNKVVVRKGEQKPIIDNKDAEKAAEEYRNFRISCGIKDPVMLNEIEEAYYEGAIRKQKTVEWSEEDEKMFNGICIDIMEYIPKSFEENSKKVNWLKSLKERYTWKPSEEQMHNLSEAAHCDCAFFNMEILKELYEDLLKLREK